MHLSTEWASEVKLEEPQGFISSPSSSHCGGSTEGSWILCLSLKGMAKIIVQYPSVTSSLNCQEEFLGISGESQRGRKGERPSSIFSETVMLHDLPLGGGMDDTEGSGCESSCQKMY